MTKVQFDIAEEGGVATSHVRRSTTSKPKERFRPPTLPAMGDPSTLLLASYLACCLVLGGSTAGGVVANALLQLLGVAIFFWCLIGQSPSSDKSRAQRLLIILALAAAALGVVQLIPLPPQIWSGFSGRAFASEGYAELGLDRPWLPLSLNPNATIYSLTALIPPLAVLLLSLRTNAAGLRTAATTVICVSVIAAILGLFQMAGASADESFYIYKITNYGRPVGFFANTNHQATLLLSAMPLLTWITFEPLKSSQLASLIQWRSLIPAAIAFLTLLLGTILTLSLAAALLLLPTLAGCLFVALAIRSPRDDNDAKRSPLLIIAGTVVVLTIVGVAIISAMNLDFSQIDGHLSRPNILRRTLAVAWDFFPTGTGFGTFREIYARATPLADIEQTFVNHAHDDYAELLLEGGVAAALLLLLFILWVGVRAAIAFRRKGTIALPMRAGLVVVLIVMTHSLVDYPVRNAAVAVVVAFGLAVFARDMPEARRSARDPAAGSASTAL